MLAVKYKKDKHRSGLCDLGWGIGVTSLNYLRSVPGGVTNLNTNDI